MKIRIEYDSGEVRNFVCYGNNPTDVFTIRTEDPAHGDEHFVLKVEPKPPVRVVHDYPANAEVRDRRAKP